MSAKWEANLRAVVSLANVPKAYPDGEVRCRACRNDKLNRADLRCWKCGHEYFDVMADELRKLRELPRPMPVKAEPPPEEPKVAPVPPQTWMSHFLLWPPPQQQQQAPQQQAPQQQAPQQQAPQQQAPQQQASPGMWGFDLAAAMPPEPKPDEITTMATIADLTKRLKAAERRQFLGKRK